MCSGRWKLQTKSASTRFSRKQFPLTRFVPDSGERIETDYAQKRMRQLSVMVTALTVAAFQAEAGILDSLLDVVGNDEIARKQAEFLVWDGVPHSPLASFEKINLIEKEWPFYLFHAVLTGPEADRKHDRSSYLVCFRLTEQTTEFRIVTVIQYASDPPTENEIRIDKRLNRWPVSPPWDARDDLPHKIKDSGLSIVLDQCRVTSER